MVDVLRREWYVEDRVLIETARILNPQFKSTILRVTGAQLEVLRNLMEYLNRRTTFASEYFNRYYLSPTVSEWDNLLAIVADLEEKLMLIYVDDYVCVRDKQAQGQSAGGFDSGDWRVRVINDEQSDSSGICSVAANQITLESGTYRCSISAPAYVVGGHQLRLWNATDSALVLLGTSEFTYVANNVATRAVIVGSFVLAATKTLEIQHQCDVTRITDGRGRACGYGEEIYTIAEFWRMMG